jgi:hypothetical protein
MSEKFEKRRFPTQGIFAYRPSETAFWVKNGHFL